MEECQICFTDEEIICKLSCCSLAACFNCLQKYFTMKIEQQIFVIECINSNCSSIVPHTEILSVLDHKSKLIYERTFICINSNGLSKMCPQCNSIETLESRKVLKRMLNKKKDNCIQCNNCCFLWCFLCHAPWHSGMSCKNYLQGDKAFKRWRNQINENNVPNAQKCPKCHVSIYSFCCKINLYFLLT